MSVSPSPGVLPRDLHEALTAALGEEPISARLLSGGMVARAARVETSGQAIFVKWSESLSAQVFRSEALGLETIRSTQTLRVPRVLAIGDAPPFLALEFIEERTPAHDALLTRNFATALARMHHDTASEQGFGFIEDNFIGALPQCNAWHQTWPTFYRECRLLPQFAMARDKGLLTAQREKALLHIIDNLETALQDLPSRPALLHGDLWSGNYLCAGEDAVVFDPALYYGEREIEIAYVELFGGFPAGFVGAYNEVYPLQAGYEQRRSLHQLYPLLVHLNYFGETYGPQVDRACEMCRTTFL